MLFIKDEEKGFSEYVEFAGDLAQYRPLTRQSIIYALAMDEHKHRDFLRDLQKIGVRSSPELDFLGISMPEPEDWQIHSQEGVQDTREPRTQK